MDNQLSTGQINLDEHSSLVENIDKYYELQKKKLADKLSPDKPPVEEVGNVKQSEEKQAMDQQHVVTVESDNDKQTETEKNHSEKTTISNILEHVAKAPVNMSDLLSKLVKTGLLPQQQPTENVVSAQAVVVATAPPTTKPANSMDEHLPPAIKMNPTLRIPDLHLKIPHLKQ